MGQFKEEEWEKKCRGRVRELKRKKWREYTREEGDLNREKWEEARNISCGRNDDRSRKESYRGDNMHKVERQWGRRWLDAWKKIWAWFVEKKNEKMGKGERGEGS